MRPMRRLLNRVLLATGTCKMNTVKELTEECAYAKYGFSKIDVPNRYHAFIGMEKEEHVLKNMP